MLLVEHGEIFAPQPLGAPSILIAGGRIEALGKIDGATLARTGVELETLDASGCFIMPGLIDVHAHLIGGSGEKGFATQTPELFASELLRAGITTVVGTLGTDTTTRTMPALIGKVKALREEGLAAFAWTGGYDARPLTGSIRDDIVLVDEIIGAGEIAIADRRSAQFSAAELARLASDCYVAGTLTKKAGVLHLHVGDGDGRLSILRDLLDTGLIEPKTIYPTHVERNEGLMSEAIDLTRRGVTIDCDVVENDLATWVRYYADAGGDPSRLTASSDAAITTPSSLFTQLMTCVREELLPREQLLALVTRNPARVLALRDAGLLRAGAIASLLLVDARSLELRTVVCGGRIAMRDGALTRREAFLAESTRSIQLTGEKVS
jgi:beta-aspartyl-dipeptidase (metallo-type)